MQRARSQRRSSRSVASMRDIRQDLLEVQDYAVPGKELRRATRSLAEATCEPHVPYHAPGRGDERSRVVERRKQRRATVLEMLARRGIAVGDDRQAARHRLERDVAEGLG